MKKHKIIHKHPGGYDSSIVTVVESDDIIYSEAGIKWYSGANETTLIPYSAILKIVATEVA